MQILTLKKRKIVMISGMNIVYYASFMILVFNIFKEDSLYFWIRVITSVRYFPLQRNLFCFTRIDCESGLNYFGYSN